MAYWTCPASVATGTLSQQSPWAVDPSFQVGHTWQSNAQLERAFGRDVTASIGVMYAKGSQLAVVSDVNLINPIGTLADGRPIYSTTVSAATRLDPRFNHIMEVQSIGDSTFKAMTLQMSKRFAHGLTFNVQYSLGKGLDNTPLLAANTPETREYRMSSWNKGEANGDWTAVQKVMVGA